jgi:hypothetical protein
LCSNETPAEGSSTEFEKRRLIFDLMMKNERDTAKAETERSEGLCIFLTAFLFAGMDFSESFIKTKGKRVAQNGIHLSPLSASQIADVIRLNSTR